MANEIVKVVGGPVAVIGDTLNIISNTILESRREEARTERLEIQARVYMHEKTEETKRVVAQLSLENEKDKRIHEERMAEIETQMLRDFYEYNIQLEKAKNLETERAKKLKMIEENIEENSKLEESFLNLFEKNPTNPLFLEYLKMILNNKENMYRERINLLKEISRI